MDSATHIHTLSRRFCSEIGTAPVVPHRSSWLILGDMSWKPLRGRGHLLPVAISAASLALGRCQHSVSVWLLHRSRAFAQWRRYSIVDEDDIEKARVAVQDYNAAAARKPSSRVVLLAERPR